MAGSTALNCRSIVPTQAALFDWHKRRALQPLLAYPSQPDSESSEVLARQAAGYEEEGLGPLAACGAKAQHNHVGQQQWYGNEAQGKPVSAASDQAELSFLAATYGIDADLPPLIQGGISHKEQTHNYLYDPG